MEEDEENGRSRLGRFKGMFEGGGKLIRRSNHDGNGALSPDHQSNASISSIDDIVQPSPQNSPQPKLSALGRTDNVKSRSGREPDPPPPVKKEKPTGKYTISSSIS